MYKRQVLNTSDISLSTGKGRHTSTRREMVLVDGSGVLIDTPGVREFGLAIDNPDSLAEMFEISDYAESCRFSDCKPVSYTHLDVYKRQLLYRRKLRNQIH